LPGCEEGVADLFEDVFRIAEDCRFNNRSHQGDAGCAVTDALQLGHLDERRYASFLKLNAEQAHNSRTLAERHQHNRQTGRLYKSIIAAKRRRQQ